MKLAIISPYALLDRYSQTDYHLILPDMIEDQKYFDFYYRQAKGYKILDNGAHESKALSAVDLFELANVLGVHEIVAPDVIGDKEKTLSLTKQFDKEANQHPQYQYMGVVQGWRYRNAIDCLLRLLDIEYLDSIGIPQHLAKIDPAIRLDLVQIIQRTNTYNAKLQVHILGANSKWPKEVQELSMIPCVSGHDTTYPVKMGLAGVDITKPAHHIPRSERYFDDTAQEGGEYDHLIMNNIKVYKEWCQCDDTL